MSQPYLGEIRMFAGNFAPIGWALCNGALQSIAENTALFNLIGTTYGGDGVNTFALPNLQGRVPIHEGTYQGTSFVLGEPGGLESVTLTMQQLPQHTHSIVASNSGQTQTPTGSLFPASATSTQAGVKVYGALNPNSPTLTNLTPATITVQGGSEPHENRQPFVTLNYIVALAGIYPSQN